MNQDQGVDNPVETALIAPDRTQEQLVTVGAVVRVSMLPHIHIVGVLK